MSKTGSKKSQDSLRNQQKIEVGDLVYLGSDIESGPIGIVLREILVSSKERWYSREFELGPFGDEQKIKLPDRIEYYCSMIGKNGKVINKPATNQLDHLIDAIRYTALNKLTTNYSGKYYIL